LLTEKLPHELDREEILLFANAVDSYPESGGESTVSKLIYSGHYRIFVIDNWGSKTIAIVTIIENPDESRNLHIAMLAGKGSLAKFDDNLKDLVELGGLEFCDRLTGIIKAENWNTFKKHGAHADEEHVLVSFSCR